MFLVGVDFQMGTGYGYSFGQDRTTDAVASNNRQFAVVNGWLEEMERAGTFKRFGMEIFNCYRESGLRAFPFVEWSEAIIDCSNGCEAVPDLANWYDGEEKK